MISALANHLWQSTLFAGAAALLTLALSRQRAHVRYSIWLAASLKFLLPFSLLVSLGGQFEWRTAPSPPPALSATIEQISRPFAPLAPTPAAPVSTAASPLSTFVISLWLCGSAFLLARWVLRWRRVRAALQSASRLPIDAPIAVMSSPSRIEPGIFGVFRPILMLPDGIRDRLTPAQFQAILAHEFCHIRRRDNLAAALHMLVEALFWFHPVVWWIGARLIDERERACDEAVLEQGSRPEIYAEGILNVCRFYLESPLPCASGVTGADLKKRIEAIMTVRILHRLTLAGKLVLAAAATAAIAAPILIGAVGRALAQSTPTLRFEVATIKPTASGGGRGGLDLLPGGELHMTGVTLKGLVAFAYGVRETQVSGGAPWMNSDAYEVIAKPERPAPADNPQTVVAPGTTAWNRVELRMQSLLAERFHLAVHKNVNQVQVYALVVAKGGLKIQPAPESDTRPPGTMLSFGRIDGRRGTMHMLAAVLTQAVGRAVVDRTGLTDGSSYALEYTHDDDANSRAASIFTALQEQLGLKLEPARVPIESIVIDRAQKPSAN